MCSIISEQSAIINAINTKGLRMRLLCVTPHCSRKWPHVALVSVPFCPFCDVELSLVSSCLQIWHKGDYQLMVDALCTQLPHTYCFYKYECMKFTIHNSQVPAA